MNEINHLSYSSITTYLDCPESWQRKYIRKEPTRKTTSLAFGSAWHSTVERLIQNPNQDTFSIWNEEFNTAFTENVSYEPTETREQHFNEGIRLLTNKEILTTINAIQPKLDKSGAMIERKIELHVPGVEIPIIGFIDVILKDGTLADFKTSARLWSNQRASDSLQSLFYLSALNQAGFEVNWEFTHFIFVKTKIPQVQIMTNEHTKGELFFLFELIRRVWESIQKESFPLNPNNWKCNEKYCDFYANCRGKYV